MTPEEWDFWSDQESSLRKIFFQNPRYKSSKPILLFGDFIKIATNNITNDVFRFDLEKLYGQDISLFDSELFASPYKFDILITQLNNFYCYRQEHSVYVQDIFKNHLDQVLHLYHVIYEQMFSLPILETNIWQNLELLDNVYYLVGSDLLNEFNVSPDIFTNETLSALGRTIIYLLLFKKF